jgi:hypothetical protein
LTRLLGDRVSPQTVEHASTKTECVIIVDFTT